MKTKKLLCALLAFVIAFTLIPAPRAMADGNIGINDPSVFLKQKASDTCTLVSSAMMLRRRAILDGLSNWSSITEDSLKSVAWGSGGLAFTFSYMGIGAKTLGLASNGYTTTAQKKAYFISMLSTHTEGIVIYNHSRPHAVLLTDYDPANDLFYCADPGLGTGRILLTNSTIPGTTQDQKLGNINQIWYVATDSNSGGTTYTVPSFSDISVTNITGTTAKLNYTINYGSDNVPMYYGLYFGTLDTGLEKVSLNMKQYHEDYYINSENQPIAGTKLQETWPSGPITGNSIAFGSEGPTLEPGITYYYMLWISDSTGEQEYWSDTYNFTTSVSQPVILTQPESTTAREGDNASFEVIASGGGLSYQWYYQKPGKTTWTAVTENGTYAFYSFAAAAEQNGYKFKCIVSNSAGTAESDVVTLTVTAKPVITSQPTSITVAEGGSASFTVVASGTGLSYQWYCRTSSSGSWVACQAASAKTATHKPAALPKYNGYQYKCIVANDADSVTSNIATLTVVAKPVITAQPTSVTVTEGGNASFSVKATGDNLSYQWYCRTSSSGSWVICQAASAKTATHKPAALAKYNGYQYKCVIKNTANGVSASVTSSIVTLTVNAAGTKPIITTQPKDCTVNEGGSASFTVVASGTGLSYQWYCRSSSTGSWVICQAASAKTATHKPAAQMKYNGYQYKCVVTNAAGSVTSSVVTLTVKGGDTRPTITEQPTSQTVNEGEKVIFDVAANGATSYQWWYQKPDSTSWTKVSNNGTSATYTLTTAARHNGYKYKCAVTNAAGTVYSSVVTLTVNMKPTITTQPKSVTVTAGKTATFKVVATGATSYKWYYQKPGESTWNVVTVNGTSATYKLTTAARHNGYKYKCVVTNSVGSVTSSVVTLMVN